MKLLFDQNLSPGLVRKLEDLYPGSSHVQREGLAFATDAMVWDHAKAHGFTIVTKDEDFNVLSVVRGAPPKIIWLQTGNCATAKVEAVLREHAGRIVDFMADPEAGTILLGG